MGEPMLRALIDAGFDVSGFDIRPSAEFGDLAENICNGVKIFAADLNVLFSVVRDISETEELLFEQQKILSHAPKLEVLVICSTLSPAYMRDLRPRIPAQIALIDAPMSGARIAAEERRLSFMLGGEVETLDRLQPLFAAMGSSFHRMGPLGAGMSAKVLNNLLAASNVVTTRLVLDWAALQGLDEDRLLALIHASSGQNWFASNFNEIEFSHEGFLPENTMGILHKDVAFLLADAPDGADKRLAELLRALIANMVEKQAR
jgi:3-hydroxyisobutyrate dehydrogenase-like beta-hydroxyacid dehydrogenase